MGNTMSLKAFIKYLYSISHKIYAYPREAYTYGLSFENFLTDAQYGGRFVGGGRRRRRRRQAATNKPAIIAALALTALPKPILTNRLLSMMGWIIAPREDPAATIDIARARLRKKYCDKTARLGTYIIPAPMPCPIPCARKFYEDTINISRTAEYNKKPYLIKRIWLA
jgi:hypothetical protein